MEAKQLQSLRAHSEQLAGFIVRLTSYYEGLSAEIDKELQSLRGHLSGKIDFTLATLSMNKVNQLIMLEPYSVKNPDSGLASPTGRRHPGISASGD